MDNDSTAEVIRINPCLERRREMLIAESPRMRELIALAERVAPTELPILLQGETGSGKDVIARLIHGCSRRRGPFVAFNCAAVPASLADSELFGHVRGAFTGAETTRPGLFEQAHQGTLLLDEVGELDLPIQAKALRIIEDGVVRPVGGASGRQVNVRIIAATHRDLLRMVELGSFREDLYHRIAGAALEVPPLRERREDITPLVLRFLNQAATDKRPRIAIEAWEWLRERDWPGNVRELRQTVHRAVALGGERLTIEDFTRLQPRRIAANCAAADEWLVGKSWSDIEIEVIRWALGRYGSVRQAAIALGRPHSTMADRVNRLGLNKSRQG